MDRQLSRRSVLRAAMLAGTGAAGLTACGNDTTPRASGPKTTLRMSWWGSTERHQRTQNALAVFSRRRPDVKVDPQFSGSDAYWEKLGSQAGGASLPDVIQMDYTYIASYAGHGWIRALDDLVPKAIDLSAFPPEVLAGGKIDNKLYGVNNGINCAALVANLTLLKQLGLDLPDATMTWADFAKLAKQVGKKSDGVYGAEYAAANVAGIECWMRQRGKPIFTADRALGFGKADLADWFAYWEDLRQAKGAAPADLQATAAGDIQNRLAARRKTAFDFANSNQLIGYASMVKDQLALHMFPQGPTGSKPGQYLKPSQFFCVSGTTQHAQEAGQLIGALLTDPEMTAILGSERGIPPSSVVRSVLKPRAGDVERATYEYIDYVSDKVGALPPPAPAGGADVTGKNLAAAAQSVSFGKATIDRAVNTFFDDAARTLKG